MIIPPGVTNDPVQAAKRFSEVLDHLVPNDSDRNMIVAAAGMWIKAALHEVLNPKAGSAK